MTPEQLYILIKTNEEAGEIVQAKSKLDLWGVDSYSPRDPQQRPNLKLLQDECADILAAIELGVELGLFDADELYVRKVRKMMKMRHEAYERS